MSDLQPEQYHKAKNDFITALGICESLLTGDAIKNIEHYLDNDELEMAYESLGLSIKEEKIDPPTPAKEILFALGPTLGLDKEGIFVANFWEEVSPLLRP